MKKADIYNKRFSFIRRHALGWLRASSRRLYILGKFIFRVFSSSQPAYILEMFTLRSSIHNRSLMGDASLIRIPAHRSELASRSFVACSAWLWNSLPFRVRSSPSQSTFDRLLRAHLLGGGGGAGLCIVCYSLYS